MRQKIDVKVGGISKEGQNFVWPVYVRGEKPRAGYITLVEELAA